MTITLRPYQREAVDAVKDELNRVDSTLLVASVGAGKTLMQAGFIQEIIDEFPEARFVCAVHTRELVGQNFSAMMDVWPFAPAGINSAALGRRETRAQILFCSIQSVFRDAARIGWTDALIIDECHLIPRKSNTMYQEFIAGLRAINPDMKLLGMSGTPFRLDSGSLIDGDGALFETIAYEVGIRQLIDEGFLVPPISKGTETTFDVGGVHVRGGDYVASELEAAVNQEKVTQAAVREIVGYSQGRKSLICFCAGVDHAKSVRDEIRRHGITCETVEGSLPAGDRKRILRAYQSGEVRCLTNVNVLSIGFNHPPIDLIALMRPTKSGALYIQQVGRGLRLAPEKKNCLVLDFAGVVRDLGPVDAVMPKKPGKGQGEAPVKLCPECFSLVHASARVCVDCGNEFEFEEKPKHKATADSAPILSGAEPEWLPVTGRRFRYHDKPGGTDSVRVDFDCGLTVHKMWVCPEHKGLAKQKADRFWARHGGTMPAPKGVQEWLDREGELRMTAEISVRPSGRYFEVVGVRPAVEMREAA